jgi:GEVED domain
MNFLFTPLPIDQRSLRHSKLLLLSLLSSSLPVLISPSLAEPPLPAGTPIENQATGTYVDTLNFDSLEVESNIVKVTVGEVAGITVVANGVTGTVSANNTVYYSFTITNAGNDATQFFIPGDAAVTGSGVQSGNIQITGYNLDGSAPVVLTAANYVTIPIDNIPIGSTVNGIATGEATALGANGIIQPGGSVVVRIPVKINASAATGSTVNVVLGNTPEIAASTTTPKARLQNQSFVDENTDQKYDLYTVDNPDGTLGEYKDPPLNGDATYHRQEASAAQRSTIIGVDYGDAPDGAIGTGAGNYQTTLSDGGPSHIIIPGLLLGTNIDSDSSLLQNVGADADNTTGTPNDEDGVSSFPVLVPAPSTTYTVPVTVTNTTGLPAYLVGYIDFNQDGDFEDLGEKSATITVTASGTNNIIFTIPAGIVSGKTYARLRLSNTQNEAESSIGAAASGEVEDYQLVVGSANVLLVKRITAINGGSLTIGGDNLSQYKDTTSPYDDNTITVINPPLIDTDPRQDTENWPVPIASFLLGGTNGGTIKPNSEMDYTIYFISTGSDIARGVTLCDMIPANQIFVANAFGTVTAGSGGLTGGDRGIVASINGVLRSYTNLSDGDIARYYPPGETLPVACKKKRSDPIPPNNYGAIIVNLGNVPTATAPGLPTDSSGFIRFRVRTQ